MNEEIFVSENIFGKSERKKEWVVGILCVLLCVFVLSKLNWKIPNFSRCFLHWKSVHRVGGCLVLPIVEGGGGGGVIRFPCQGIAPWPTCIPPVQGCLKWSVKCLFAETNTKKSEDQKTLLHIVLYKASYISQLLKATIMLPQIFSFLVKI